MTMLEKFLSFAQALPADRLHRVEEALEALMTSHSEEYDLSPLEIATIDRRLAEANPQFADPESISRLFGKPLGA